MIFNSINYIVFFSVVVAAYYTIARNCKTGFLLLASYYFYVCWDPRFLIVLLFSTLVTYVFGLALNKVGTKQLKLGILILALVFNIGSLFIFKYANFAVDSIQSILEFCSLSVKLNLPKFLLPVGISFYTFKTVSYLIDVYTGKIHPEKRFERFALYISFFPSLLAGPIDRAGNFLPQISNKISFNEAKIKSGLKLICWGLFKKVVIADQLAIYVDTVYNNIYHHTGMSYIIATYFYTFQIYCDFSGYSDIAIGCGLILGLQLMPNFNFPYFSTSMRDFWRRWHISLSTWFRDYVYIPLGGNRVSSVHMYFNFFITMTLCGVWHGAAWNFVVWGMLHSAFLCFDSPKLPYAENLRKYFSVPKIVIKWWKIFITFQIVSFLWIFFRVNSLSDAAYILKNLFKGWPHFFIESTSLSHGVFWIAILMLFEIFQQSGGLTYRFQKLPVFLRYSAYCSFIMLIVFFGVDGASQFIYFQF